MGQKTNPIGNRLGIIRGWDSNWYGGNDYGDKLAEDHKIRKYIHARLSKASVSKVIIERTLKKMLQPKRTKYRKVQKGKMKGNSQRGHELSNGMFGIKSVHEDGMFLTSRQIEAARIAATRFMKREGQLWIKIFPDKPITKKPLEVRMGKGKGAVEYWAAVVKPGRIMFEVGGVPLSVAKEALRLAAQKLPVKTKFVVLRNLLKENYNNSKELGLLLQTKWINPL
uniref:Large ribosomal subunit protein uL16m n=1 Tax=Hucho hucho TaxID=62062 RepID=A0A4W5LAI7_9TELE